MTTMGDNFRILGQRVSYAKYLDAASPPGMSFEAWLEAQRTLPALAEEARQDTANKDYFDEFMGGHNHD